MNEEEYLAQAAATRPQRLRWWQEARFGMFVHWGLYAQLGRHEWVMNRERIPLAEYEKLVEGMNRYGRSLHIPQEEFLNGNWLPWFEQALSLPPAKETMGTDGARVAAETLSKILTR